ncbi:hypothetical protein [Trinickia sp.]|uniref:hypothetical protein n=1 Tax=Trinickia sp. TaxID=2571163 RepID=UPI003F806C96
MATYNLDEGFGAAIVAAGLGGLQFSWDNNGNLYFGDSITAAQKASIEAAAAAYKPA